MSTKQECGCLRSVMCKKIYNLACARVLRGEEKNRGEWRCGERDFAWLNVHSPMTSTFKDYVPMLCSANTIGRHLCKMKTKVDILAQMLHLKDNES